MSSDELKTVVKIFEYKEIKSDHIFYQRYAEAANARDCERDYEWKLLNILGYEPLDACNSMKKEKLLNNYFLEKFKIEYPKKITTEFKNSVLRQIKLNELGI